MPHRDVIVIGASSGGVAPLVRLVRHLPPDLPAAIFVVLHVNPDAPSQLPAILNRAGGLRAAHGVDDEPIRRSRIYVAPPGFQMYVHHNRLSVRRGPQENLHRPAIDPMFRTAAHHYGPRVIGIVLSGALDDGSAGLRAVKHGGGIAIVQDPNDALVAAMPANAMEYVDVDHAVASADLAPLLINLVSRQDTLPPFGDVALETAEEAAVPDEAYRSEELGITSPFTCPDCSGALWEIDEARGTRFRCRVGHAYSEEAMIKAQGDSVERALWTALRALEERVALLNKLAGHARARGHVAVAAMFESRSKQADEDVRALHDVIMSGRALEQVGPEAI